MQWHLAPPGAQARVVGNTLAMGAHHEFRALPEGAVEGGWTGHDRKPIAVPAGWRPASRADLDMAVVAEKVIAPFGLSACWLAVRRGETDAQGFSSFCTKNTRTPGTVSYENDSNITALPDGTYTIDDWCIRLLIRRQARGARGAPCARPAARSRIST